LKKFSWDEENSSVGRLYIEHFFRQVVTGEGPVRGVLGKRENTQKTGKIRKKAGFLAGKTANLRQKTAKARKRFGGDFFAFFAKFPRFCPARPEKANPGAEKNTISCSRSEQLAVLGNRGASAEAVFYFLY
jgi:hypothetical protein